MIGNEDNPYNFYFVGAIGLALLGAVVARFRAGGMALAMFVAGIAHAAIALGGVSVDPRGAVFSLGFAFLWLLSAVLFRKDAQDQAAGRASSGLAPRPPVADHRARGHLGGGRLHAPVSDRMTDDEVGAVHEVAHAVFAVLGEWTKLAGPVVLKGSGYGDVVMATDVEASALLSAWREPASSEWRAARPDGR